MVGFVRVMTAVGGTKRVSVEEEVGWISAVLSTAEPMDLASRSSTGFRSISERMDDVVVGLVESGLLLDLSRGWDGRRRDKLRGRLLAMVGDWEF